MIQTIKSASLELNSLNNKQVVKVAGAVRRIKNWYKKLTDPEYKEKLLKLKSDSDIVKNELGELYKNINAVQSAIKDSDVESYNFAIDRIKDISSVLSKELSKYEQTAKSADPDLKNKNVAPPPQNVAQTFAPSLDRIENVYISDKVKTNDWNVKTLRGSLERHGVPAEQISNFMSDPAKIVEFYSNMAKAVKEGQIVKSWDAAKTKLEIDRSGEIQYKVITAPFMIPGTSFKMQVTVEGTDLSTRANSPKPTFSVRSFSFVDARQRNASKIRTKMLKAMLEG